MVETSEIQQKTPSQSHKRSAIDQLIALSVNLRRTAKVTIYKIGHIEKANMELGIRQMKQGKFFDACLRFKFVLVLNKNNVIAYYLLGKCYYYRGKYAEAIPQLQQALRMQPDLEEAAFLLACCGSNSGIKAIPRSFIIDKLDLLAVNYDNFIATTTSKINAAIDEELKKILGDTMSFNILDLGCRGGDTSQMLRSRANVIIGVEPSLKMIALARTRRTDNLLTFNQVSGKFPEDYLRESKEKFPIVFSTFYLDNIGPLDDYFQLVYNAVESKGLFVFNININKGPEDYIFRPGPMMFAHSPKYIDRLAQKTGFAVTVKREVVYGNGSSDIVYIFTKQ